MPSRWRAVLGSALSNVRAYILAYDTESVEWIIYCGLMVYGFTLAAPYETYRLSFIYSVLSGLVPETILGIVLAGAGLAGAIALIFNSPVGRKHAALSAFVLYLFLCLALIANFPFSLANLLLVLCGSSLWCYLRLSRMVRNGQRDD